ncbi:MAG: hypothetical protein J0I41_02570 [Filimonas sp.]|nr:hypothetical protein [Filimonas sp.]
MNTFYYEQLYSAARKRISALTGISAQHKKKLLETLKEYSPHLITAEDIEQVLRNAAHSLGNMLCPQAMADYTGVSRLVEGHGEHDDMLPHNLAASL